MAILLNLLALVSVCAVIHCKSVPTHYPHLQPENYNLYTPQFTPFFGKSLKGNFWFGYQYCKAIGMQVVTPNTPEKMTQLVEFMKKHKLNNVWTSGNDLATEGNFIWMVNSSLLDYADWHGGQPDDAGKNEDCLEVWNINGVHKMNDRPCYEEFPVVCESVIPYYNYPPC